MGSVLFNLRLLLGLCLGLSFVSGASRPLDCEDLKAVVDMSYISMSLNRYYDRFGRYPTVEEGLHALDVLTEHIVTRVDTLIDPWGNEYVYVFPAVHSSGPFELYSLGPDGESVTGGMDEDDINSWSVRGICPPSVFGVSGLLLPLAIGVLSLFVILFLLWISRRGRA